MTTLVQFQIKDFLTPHRYRKTFRAHLTFNLPHFSSRYHREVEVSIKGSLRFIALSTYWLRHQIRQKTSQNAKKYLKMVDSWMCVQHHLFWGHAGGQILVLVHCVKLGIDGRCYENRRIFVVVKKKWQRKWQRKKSIFKIFIFDFLIFPSCCVKNNWIFFDFDFLPFYFIRILTFELPCGGKESYVF